VSNSLRNYSYLSFLSKALHSNLLKKKSLYLADTRPKYVGFGALSKNEIMFVEKSSISVYAFGKDNKQVDSKHECPHQIHLFLLLYDGFS